MGEEIMHSIIVLKDFGTESKRSWLNPATVVELSHILVILWICVDPILCVLHVHI